MSCQPIGNKLAPHEIGQHCSQLHHAQEQMHNLYLVMWFFLNGRRKEWGQYLHTYIPTYTDTIIIFYLSLQCYWCIAMQPTGVKCLADADAMWSIQVSCSQSTNIISPIPAMGVYRCLYCFLPWETCCLAIPNSSTTIDQVIFLQFSGSHMIHTQGHTIKLYTIYT